MSGLAVFSDGVFVFIAGFFLFFTVGYYLLPLPVAAALSFLSSIFLLVFILMRKTAKREKAFLTKKDAERIENAALYLSVTSKNKVNNLFFSALSEKYGDVSRERHGFFSPKENTLFFALFSSAVPQKKDVVLLFNLLKEGEKGVIYSVGFSEEVRAFSALFGDRITLLDKNEACRLLFETQAAAHIADPPLPTDVKRRKNRFSPLLFHRKKALPIFFSGLFFLLTSFLVPIKAYYVIAGSLFILLALFIRLFGKK